MGDCRIKIVLPVFSNTLGSMSLSSIHRQWDKKNSPADCFERGREAPAGVIMGGDAVFERCTSVFMQINFVKPEAILILSFLLFPRFYCHILFQDRISCRIQLSSFHIGIHQAGHQSYAFFLQRRYISN